MNDTNISEITLSEVVKLPVSYNAKDFSLRDRDGNFLADIEPSNIFWLKDELDYNWLGNFIAQALNERAEMETENERLKEDAKNGGDWFNAFQEVEDYMLQRELWGEEDIKITPAETLISGIKRLEAERATLNSLLESVTTIHLGKNSITFFGNKWIAVKEGDVIRDSAGKRIEFNSPLEAFESLNKNKEEVCR